MFEKPRIRIRTTTAEVRGDGADHDGGFVDNLMRFGTNKAVAESVVVRRLQNNT